MQDLTVAAVQMNSPLGAVPANLRQHVKWTRQAAAAGAHLVFFPELSLTGHWCAGGTWDVAEAVPEGPSTQTLARLAAELGLHICFGLAEKESGIAYNTQVVVGPQGYVGKQRKLHLSGDEYFHFRAGTAIPVLDIGRCRLALGICYDNLLPEVSRVAAVRGAEVYLMPHAARIGPLPRTAARQAQAVASAKALWRKVYATRAYDNGMYVVVCNQAGQAATEPLAVHAGGVMMLDPRGEVVAESQTTRLTPEMVVSTLTAEGYEVRRRQACFNLQTRRPELYGGLTEPTS